MSDGGRPICEGDAMTVHAPYPSATVFAIGSMTAAQGMRARPLESKLLEEKGMNNLLVTLPTPLTDAVMCRDGDPWMLCQALERDAMTMALRLYGESYDTFSPETMECMDRWKPRVKALLEGTPA